MRPPLGLFFAVMAGVLATSSSSHAWTITRMEADFERPWIYAIHDAAGGGVDSLVFLNTNTGNVERVIPIGANATDLAVHAAEGRLYVTNWGTNATRRVDLTTQQELTPVAMGTDVYRIAAGAAGRVITEGYDQWVNVTLANSASGTSLATAWIREGDGVASPDGLTYYHCDNNISNASIHRYDVSGGAFQPLNTSSVHAYGSRQLVMSADGARLFWQRWMYDATLTELADLAQVIAATTLHGTLAFSSTSVINTMNGQVVYSLPFTTSVMAVSGDQERVFLHNPSTGGFLPIKLSEIAPVPGPGLNPVPANGWTVTLPLAQLSWDISPVALRYEVYFGTDSTAVDTATTASPEFLGSVTATKIDLSRPLSPGSRYWWRVDVVGFTGVRHGRPWHFDVAPIVVAPHAVATSMVTGAPIADVPLALGSATSQAWTVSNAAAWLSPDHASGVTPDTLRLRFDASSLAPGIHRDTLWFESAGARFAVPVALTLFQAQVTRMVADLVRPVIYALHPGTGLQSDGYLLFVHATSGVVEQAMPIGRNPTDLALNPADDRLYVTNHGQPLTRVVDPETRTELAALALGTDVYRINGARAGRLLTEGLDQWVDLRLIDTRTAATIRSTGIREGDGEASMNGRYYYHCDNNISNASIHRFTVNGDSLTELGTSNQHPYGNRSLLLSPDGSRLFWRGYVFDAALAELGYLGPEVLATTLHGTLAFSSTQAFDVERAVAIAALPWTASALAVSADQTTLVAFEGATGRFRTLPLAGIAPVPGPGLNPTPADRSVVAPPLAKLSWLADPRAITYDVYFGADSAAVRAAGRASPEFLGNVAATERALAATLLPDHEYYWRVDVVTDGSLRTGPLFSFRVAPISVAPHPVEVIMATGAPVPPVRLALGGDPGTPWSATISRPWLSLDRSSGTTPDSLVLSFDPSSLTAGIHRDTLRFTSGTATFGVPVTLRLVDLVVTQMVTDYERPYVYALHAGSGGLADALLAFIHTGTERIEKIIPIGRRPTDMALHAAEGRLYVTNWGQPVTRVVDLTAQTELPPLGLGTDVYRINAGRPGRIWIEEEDQWINIRLVNTATGATLATLFEYQGDGDSSPDGSVYYHADHGISNAALHRYDARTDSPTETRTGPERSPGSRQLVISGDGSRLFWQRWAYDTSLTELGAFDESIVATTMRGTIAFSANRAYNASNGQSVYTLPWTSGVMAVSGDQSKLFVYGSGAVHAIPMSDIAPVPGPGLNPVPADGAVVVAPINRLTWDASPVATSYDVYFGTDSAAVSNATGGDPEFLGNTTTTSLTLTRILSLGQRCYWRVDAVGYSGTRRGGVWSFTVAPVQVSPRHLTVRMVTHAPVPDESLILTAVGATPWTVTNSRPWLQPRRASGSTPDTLRVGFDVTGLASGTHADTLWFTADGMRFPVPVTLVLFDLRVTQMVTDYERPYVYALHPGSGTFPDAFLAFLNTNTERIDRVIPIGTNPTDMALHMAEGRLYVTNWGQPVTRVVDLATRTEIAPLSLGTDVYKVNASRAGRLWVEEEDQWVGLRLVNTTNGAVVRSFSVREGDGETSPDASIYYHCDNNISNASIHRYDASTDSPTEIGTSAEHPYGSRTLVLSGDGQRLFWQRWVYDARLTERGHFAEPIVATTMHGTVAFSANHAFDTATGLEIYTIPYPSGVMAASGDQRKLFVFDATSGQIRVIPMSSIATLPEGLSPLPPDRSVVPPPVTGVSWDLQPAAVRYEVYFGADSVQVAAATHASPEYLGSTVEPRMPLASPLGIGQSAFWRVDILGFSSLRRGSVWKFTIAPMEVVPPTVSVVMAARVQVPDVRVRLDAPSAVPWTLTTSSPWLTVSHTSGSTPDSVTLHFDTVLLPAGVRADTLRFTAGGTTFGVPLQLTLFDLEITKMVSDPNRPYVYALHPGSGSFADAYLAFLNTHTEEIETVLPIGTNPTDLSLCASDGLLYVTNWGQPVTRVVDVVARRERTPLALGTDVYRINAGRPGRLYTEEHDQWIYLRTIDSNTGAVLASTFVREGDGETSPTGDFYYHCDNNISNASIHRYSTTTDTPAEINRSPEFPYGTRSLLISGDGTRLFWQGRMFSSGLGLMRDFGEPIYATTVHGTLAFGAERVFDTATGQIVYTLPFPSTAMVVSGDQGKLFAYRPSTHMIQAVRFNGLVPTLDADFRQLDAEPADGGVRVSWAYAHATNARGFHVYRADGDAESWDRLTPAPLPSAVTSYLDPTAEPGRTYQYRVGVLLPDHEGWSPPVVMTAAPTVLALQAIPNPSKGPMRFRLSLPRATTVQLDVYDLNGRLVRRARSGAMKAGVHAVEWDGRDSRGEVLAAGVYFCRMHADGRQLMTRVVMTR